MELVKQQASSKRRLKLGDIAEHLQVKKFVIRTWEKELGLAPQSGFYGAEAIELFKKIKQLVLVERQPFTQVRTVIGVALSAESVVVAEEAALSMVAPAVTVAAEEIDHVVEEVALANEADLVLDDQSGAVENDEQLCNAAKDCDDVVVAAIEEPVAPAAEEHFVAAAACQSEEIEAACEDVSVAVVAESMMVAPAELYEAVAEQQNAAAGCAHNEQAQQRFRTELAFFRQELLKFQQLLNT